METVHKIKDKGLDTSFSLAPSLPPSISISIYIYIYYIDRTEVLGRHIQHSHYFSKALNF